MPSRALSFESLWEIIMAISAFPRANLQGIRDDSFERALQTVERLPTHLPYMWLLTERGREDLAYVSGNEFDTMFGAKSLDPQYPFATHQTALARIAFLAANDVMVQRLRPANAATAFIRLSVELIAATIPVYVRNPDGSVQHTVNEAGNVVPSITGYTNGTRVVWHAGVSNYSGVTAQYRKGVVVTGFRSGDWELVPDSDEFFGQIFDGESTYNSMSNLYPIMDLEVDSFGAYGNNIGLIINQLDGDSAELVSLLRCALYQFTCVERMDGGNVSVLPTRAGMPYVTLGLVDGLVNPDNGLPCALGSDLVPAYQDTDDAALIPVYGPFGRVHVYQANYRTVLGRLINGYTEQGVVIPGESTVSTAFQDPTTLHTFNLFTGTDLNGNMYRLTDASNSFTWGGLNMSSGSPIYATGGSDGLVVTNGAPDALANTQIYDTLVYRELSEFGSYRPVLLDMARYPYSIVYDTGFSLSTKKQFANIINKRKDAFAILSTFSVADYVGPEIVEIEPEPLGAPTFVFSNDTNADGVIVNGEFVEPTTLHVNIPLGAEIGTAYNVAIQDFGVYSGMVSSADLARGYVILSLDVQAEPLPAPVITFPADFAHAGMIVLSVGVNIVDVQITIPAGVVIGDRWSIDTAGFGSQSELVTHDDLVAGFISVPFALSPNNVLSVSAHFDHKGIGGNIGNANIAVLSSQPV